MFPISEIESNPSAQCPPWRCYGCGWGGSCTHPPPPRQARTRCTSQGPQCRHPQTWFQEEIAEKNVSFGLNACWKAPPPLPRLHCALSPNALCRNPRLQSACHRRRNSQSVKKTLLWIMRSNQQSIISREREMLDWVSFLQGIVKGQEHRWNEANLMTCG